jgi:hypothetical protein
MPIFPRVQPIVDCQNSNAAVTIQVREGRPRQSGASPAASSYLELPRPPPVSAETLRSGLAPHLPCLQAQVDPKPCIKGASPTVFGDIAGWTPWDLSECLSSCPSSALCTPARVWTRHPSLLTSPFCCARPSRRLPRDSSPSATASPANARGQVRQCPCR